MPTNGADPAEIAVAAEIVKDEPAWHRRCPCQSWDWIRRPRRASNTLGPLGEINVRVMSESIGAPSQSEAVTLVIGPAGHPGSDIVGGGDGADIRHVRAGVVVKKRVGAAVSPVFNTPVTVNDPRLELTPNWRLMGVPQTKWQRGNLEGARFDAGAVAGDVPGSPEYGWVMITPSVVVEVGGGDAGRMQRRRWCCSRPGPRLLQPLGSMPWLPSPEVTWSAEPAAPGDGGERAGRRHCPCRRRSEM